MTEAHSIEPIVTRPAVKHLKGRICANEDCGTRLSVYNGTKFCSLHVERKKVYARGVSL